MHLFSGTKPWLERLSVTIHLVRANIRNQGPVGLWIFHISTARFKERKSIKKKETATTDPNFVLLHLSLLLYL